MSRIVTVRPAELDPNAIGLFKVGSLLINSTTADLYCIIEDNGVKKAQLVSGAGVYEIRKHLEFAHIISPYDPITFNKATMWYNTDIVYVEPEDLQEAYISVRAETHPGSGVYKWQKILPMTSLKNVIVGKKNDGSIMTMNDLVKNGRTLLKPAIQIDEAEKGEIFLKDDATLWWRTTNDPNDDILLANTNPNIIERMKKQIHFGENPPTNWDQNSLWIKSGDDAGIVDALTYSVYKSDADNITGLKFVPDSDSKVKQGATLLNDGKKVSIDLNTAEDFGHIITNYHFQENTSYYMEVYVEDPEDKAILLLLGDNVPQATSMTYGTELDESTLLIDTAKSKFKNKDTSKTFKMDKKTIFIIVEKTNNRANIKLGTVLDDGTLNYIHGTDTTAGFIQNTTRLALGAYKSTTSNSKVQYSIRSFKVSNLPNNTIGLNNVLPGETAFDLMSPLTNAQSVYLTGSQSLSNLHAGAGRLISTPRDYKNRDTAKSGELLLNFDENKLYGKAMDGSIFPIAGSYDNKIAKHLVSSLQVSDLSHTTYQKDNDDPTKIYISKYKPEENWKYATNFIRGAWCVIDNSTSGDKTTYRIVTPYSDTLATYHDWEDIVNENQKRGTLKEYLDYLQDAMKKYMSTKALYSSHEELGIENDDIKDKYNTDVLFLTQAAKMMKKESIYVDTVKKIDPSNPTTNYIDNVFNAPDDGYITVRKDTNDKLYVELNTYEGQKYSAHVNAGNKIVRWNKNLIMNNNVVRVPGNLYADEEITAKNLKVDSISTLNGNVENTNNVWSISTTHTDINKGRKTNVFKYAANFDDTMYIKLGEDNPNVKDISLHSNNKPYWSRPIPNPTGSGTIYKKEPWLTKDDFGEFWQYRGVLSGTEPVDLNTLKDTEHIGYWLLNTDTSKKDKNYPADGTTGFLEVTKEGQFVSHRFTYTLLDKSGGTDHTAIVATRDSYDGGTTWTPWIEISNSKKLDLSGYYEKTGGLISGSAEIRDNITVHGDSVFEGNTYFNGVIAHWKSAFGSNRKVMSFKKDENNKDVIQYGEWTLKDAQVNYDRGVENHEFWSKKIPGWYNNHVTTQYSDGFHRFLLDSDYDDLLDKINKKTIDTSNFMKKDGDTGKNNYTWEKGITKYANAGQMYLPTIGVFGKITATNYKGPGEIDGYEFYRDAEQTEINMLKSNFIGDGNPDSLPRWTSRTGFSSYNTTYNTGNTNSVANDVVILHFGSDRDGLLTDYSNFNNPTKRSERVLENSTTNIFYRLVGEKLGYTYAKNHDSGSMPVWKYFLFDDDIQKDWTNTTNRSGGKKTVASPELVANSPRVSANKGLLSKYVTKAVTDELSKLEPGNYSVSTLQQLEFLGIDKDKLKMPDPTPTDNTIGSLIVMSEPSLPGHIIQFMPKDGEGFTTKVEIQGQPTRWKYITELPDISGVKIDANNERPVRSDEIYNHMHTHGKAKYDPTNPKSGYYKLDNPIISVAPLNGVFVVPELNIGDRSKRGYLDLDKLSNTNGEQFGVLVSVDPVSKEGHATLIPLSHDRSYAKEEDMRHAIIVDGVLYWNNSTADKSYLRLLRATTSSEFGVTGREDSHTIPYLLTHSHKSNHPQLKRSDPSKVDKTILIFSTNVFAQAYQNPAGIDNKKIMNIKLEGFSETSMMPIDITFTVVIEGNEVRSVVHNNVPGSITDLDVFMLNNHIAFSIRDAQGSEGISFDTRIRLSNISQMDTKSFTPKVTALRYTKDGETARTGTGYITPKTVNILEDEYGTSWI